MRPGFRRGSIAAALLLFGWFLLSPSRSPALAEVILQARNHKVVKFRSIQTTDDRETRLTANGERTIYIDMENPRVREEEHHKTMNDVLDFRFVAVYDYVHDRFLAASSNEQVLTKDQTNDEHLKTIIGMIEEKKLARKEAVVSRIADTRTDAIPPMSMLGKDRGFLENLRELQADQNTLVTSAILDGREFAKYRLRKGNLTRSLWVDRDTKLPVRLEIEMIDPTPRIARNEWVYTDFEWDLKGVDLEVLFSTEPPKGYVVEDRAGKP